MGKKDKKQDKEKQEAKKLRQAAKLEKGMLKLGKQTSIDSGEGDLESLIAEYKMKEATKTSVKISGCQQPTPRSNFSLTALPNGDFIMFGGEFCDGLMTQVFNDVYRWKPDKKEWKSIESLNTPPPRCSHQAVFYNDKIYIFGGEFTTLEQFHHYKDMWCLDLKTFRWTEVPCGKVAPSARSGHRMVVWRNYIVLFGGFFDALRDVRWFNDLFFFSFQEETWAQAVYQPHSLVPHPRSGVQLCVHAAEDTLYLFSGYSKEKEDKKMKAQQATSGKERSSQPEGRIHDDMWSISLKAAVGTGTGGSGSARTVDTSKLAWQRVKKRGQFPSPRCSASSVVYKNKFIIFGGVFDEEGPRHSIQSTFFNDIYAFDLDRKNWFMLTLKAPKEKKVTKRQKKKSSGIRDIGDATKHTTSAEKGDNQDSDQSDGAPSDDDESSSGDESKSSSDEDSDSESKGDSNGSGGSPGKKSDIVSIELAQKVAWGLKVGDADHVSQPTEESKGVDEEDESSSDSDSDSDLDLDPASSSIGQGKAAASRDTSESPAREDPLRIFAGRTDPVPRLNSCLALRGHTMYVYGGVVELGDIEVCFLFCSIRFCSIRFIGSSPPLFSLLTTNLLNSLFPSASVTTNGKVTLDDCWSIDLNKRDIWNPTLAGTMKSLVWKGENGDDDTTTDGGDAESHGDDSDSSSGSGSGSDTEAIVARKEKPKEKATKGSSKATKKEKRRR
jgi:N-acetylneuraminic acid mutarotase